MTQDENSRSSARRGTGNSRAAAAGIVRRWMETGEFPDRLMDSVESDRAFIMELVYGVVKHCRSLEWVMDRCVQRRPRGPLVPFLLVGLYQVLLAKGMKPHAAVNETVAAVKKELSRGEADFTNAVLRRVDREREAVGAALAGQSLGVRESHPDVLVQRWIKHFGELGATNLCRWDNTAADVILRICKARTDMAAFIESLSKAGIAATPHPFDPARYCVLPRGVAVTAVPGFDEGLFMVQDPSTAMAVDLLGPAPGEAILDGCAAPGGKTTAIAERMAWSGTLVAADAHEDRMALLRQNLERDGSAGFVIEMKADLTDPAGALASMRGRFDGILLDVPCTNTGVLRRRPDARWRFSATRLRRIAQTQRAILDNAIALLKPGGRLVYSTCSLEPEEDEQLVAAWVREHPAFVVAAERRLFPPNHNTDGAYAALLRPREGVAPA